ncbi:MAG: ABC transporter ATP-binding protein [Oscillospiraceae bacterium]|nr:ABC transporter ATP-binding protein [Oscillospiraceae bacterium]
MNPVFTVGQQITDIIKYSGYHGKLSKKELRNIAYEAIIRVMISDPERIFDSYPYQLSGGMRQRVCIASALVTPRDLLIADEPCTALDVTIQSQIHRLLRDLTTDSKRAFIMITHSIGVARELVDSIFVMYAGNIVENAAVSRILGNPLHPYTQGLIDCIPRLSGGGLSTGIYGYMIDYITLDYGCRFCKRCKHATERCEKEQPALSEVEWIFEILLKILILFLI